MKSEEIHFSDWQRILIGEVPGLFYVELIIRVAVVYLLLIVCMRMMGKRMSTQLSRTEMVAMVALAASIGIPVMSPDRGLLPALVSAAAIVVGQRLLARWSAASERFEMLVQDDMSVLIRDGELQLDAMKETRVTRERLFAQLRSKGLFHLGSVKFLLMEPDGKFTLIDNPDPRPGLSILPDWDSRFRAQQPESDTPPVCKNCGHTQPASGSAGQPCDRCGDQNWVAANTDPEKKSVPAA